MLLGLRTNITLKLHIKPKRPKSPIPPPKSDLEQSYYQHQAYLALHSAGVHIHFTRENE